MKSKNATKKKVKIIKRRMQLLVLKTMIFDNDKALSKHEKIGKAL